MAAWTWSVTMPWSLKSMWSKLTVKPVRRTIGDGNSYVKVPYCISGGTFTLISLWIA